MGTVLGIQSFVWAISNRLDSAGNPEHVSGWISDSGWVEGGTLLDLFPTTPDEDALTDRGSRVNSP
jgi:hypothetical protein